MTVFDSASLWILGLLFCIVLSITIEIGYRLGKRVGKGRGLNKHPVEASIAAALLGLMSFMLAFTFGAGTNRYATMRELAMEDANLAGTLYLRAQLLPADKAAKARALTREYLQSRYEAVKNRDPESLERALQRSAEIQEELWDMAMKATGEVQPPLLALFIGALNELIDHDARRQTTAFSNRLHSTLWITLTLLGLLATAMLGFTSGLHGKRSVLATTVLIVAFAAVFVLIVDLDRPFHSLFKRGDPVAQRTLESMGR